MKKKKKENTVDDLIPKLITEVWVGRLPKRRPDRFERREVSLCIYDKIVQIEKEEVTPT